MVLIVGWDAKEAQEKAEKEKLKNCLREEDRVQLHIATDEVLHTHCPTEVEGNYGLKERHGSN